MPKLTACILALAAMLLPLVAVGQEVDWNVDASVVANNREGGDEMTPDQTFMFTRLAGEVGLSLDGGTHRLMAGAAWYQPMRDDCGGYKVLPTVYYNYRKDGVELALGMLPRTLMAEKAPTYLFSDSLNYLTPNVRGALAQYTCDKGHAMVLLDWRQMQTNTRREAFNVLLNGQRHIAGDLWIGGWAQLNHLAKRKNAPEDEGVNDDISINPMARLDLARHTSLDKLTLEAGALIQLQRARHEHEWRTPCRFVARANARWRWLEATEEFSTGKDAFPLYPAFGSQLNLGDPYYRYKTYSRTDVRAHIINNRFVDLSASLMFHAATGVTGFWQQVSCRFYLDSRLWKRRTDKTWMKQQKLNSIF